MILSIFITIPRMPHYDDEGGREVLYKGPKGDIRVVQFLLLARGINHKSPLLALEVSNEGPL